MMATRVLALGLLITLVVGGCARAENDEAQVATAEGSANPTTSAQADASADDHEQALKFSQCMRDQGLDWFPDPVFDGDGGIGMRIQTPEGVDKEEVDAAMEACKQFQPNGGEDRVASPEELENARLMSQCMRDNGIENFPDPTGNGGILIDPKKLGIDPESEEFKAAQEACKHLRPGAAPGTQQQEG